MNIIATDGTELYCKDWGQGQPFVFCHGWPLDSDAFEDQMFFLASHGYRCIGFDRRGHGRSSQPWTGNDMDTWADDLAQVIDTLKLRDVILVGHSTGGGVVTRYVGRYGTDLVGKVVLIGSVTPVMVKSVSNPEGLPMQVFDQIRGALVADRAQFFRDFSLPFYGYNRPGAKPSEGVRDSFWRQAMLAGLPNVYESVRAFSETDLAGDVRKLDVPTLVLHGGDDQVVPVANAYHTSRIAPEASLRIIKGAPHGLCTTHKQQVNEDLLAFAKGQLKGEYEEMKYAR